MQRTIVKTTNLLLLSLAPWHLESSAEKQACNDAVKELKYLRLENARLNDLLKETQNHASALAQTMIETLKEQMAKSTILVSTNDGTKANADICNMARDEVDTDHDGADDDEDEEEDFYLFEAHEDDDDFDFEEEDF